MAPVNPTENTVSDAAASENATPDTGAGAPADRERELPPPDQDGIPANGTKPIEPRGPEDLAPVART